MLSSSSAETFADRRVAASKMDIWFVGTVKIGTAGDQTETEAISRK